MFLWGRTRLGIGLVYFAKKLRDIVEPRLHDSKIFPGLRQLAGWNTSLSRT